MSNAPVDNGRRRFLTVSTCVVGGVGAIGAAVPFIASWQPSDRAKAAGADVEVDISKLEPGQLMRVEWRSKPVFIVRRTKEILDALEVHEDQLKDADSAEPQQPGFAQNRFRALKDEYLVLVGICTHLGCSPQHIKDGAFEEIVNGVKDGFFCPCHGSKFDMSGRVFAGVPAGLNLVVPPYQFLSDDILNIGSEGEVA